MPHPDLVRLVGATVALGLLTAASPVSAQTTFRACRVPTVGAIYMIDVTGGPSACLDASHVEFQWSEGTVADGSVTTSKLADGAVTQAKLDGSVTLPLGTGSVGAAQLANDAVSTTAKIADGAVQAADLASSAVTSVKIANGAVVGGKIAVDAITTATLIDGAVTTEKIADGTIAAVDHAVNSIGGAQIADGSLTGADLAAGSVSATQIVPGSIGTAEVGDGTLTADDLAANSVGYSELALEIVSVIEASPRASDVIGATAVCPSNKRPIAGGFRWTSYVPGNVEDAALQLSHPVALGWIVTYRDPSPYGVTGLEVYAVCVRP